jgi:hypothetical protein
MSSVIHSRSNATSIFIIYIVTDKNSHAPTIGHCKKYNHVSPITVHLHIYGIDVNDQARNIIVLINAIVYVLINKNVVGLLDT